MSHRSTLKTLIFVSLVSLLLAGCSGGSGGADSEHGLVPTPIAETNGTDTNTSTGGSGGGTDTHTAPDTNGTQTDTNGTIGGGDDGNSTGGGTDTNASAGGGNDTNGTVGGKDDNSTGGDTNGTIGGGGNDGNSTGGGSNDGNATGGGDTNTTVTLSALKLTIADHTLNKDHNTTLTLTATYSDHTTKPLTSGITWIITPQEAVTLHSTTLTALKDTNVTVQAKVNNVLSNKIKLNIYWEVNGHRLPPEPDPKVNNATLLGVDINKNGVRDDVERWIYEKYKDKHPIHIDIAMQAGRAYKLVLEHPERAKEIRERVNAPYFCGAYYQNDAKYVNGKILIHERIDTPVESKYFNTKDRSDAYRQYDHLLSGDSYDIPWPDEQKAMCDFNTSKYDKE